MGGKPNIKQQAEKIDSRKCETYMGSLVKDRQLLRCEFTFAAIMLQWGATETAAREQKLLDSR